MTSHRSSLPKKLKRHFSINHKDLPQEKTVQITQIRLGLRNLHQFPLSQVLSKLTLLEHFPN